MKTRLVVTMLSGALLALAAGMASAKPRVLVLTDIENEPDDAMSMVRFLVYANQFDVEGLVATTSIHRGRGPRQNGSAGSSTPTRKYATTWSGTRRGSRARTPCAP